MTQAQRFQQWRESQNITPDLSEEALEAALETEELLQNKEETLRWLEGIPRKRMIAKPAKVTEEPEDEEEELLEELSAELKWG